MCLVHSHGWALHDENSFHDGLMSFWLWFLPNSAHSDGPWLPDWKRYIWEECGLLNTSCGCYVSRSFVMVEPSVMRTVFTTVLWASGFDSYQTQLTLTGHGYLIESDIFGRSVACRIPAVVVVCLVRYILMVEPSVMRTVFTTVLWASGFDSYQTQLTLTDHGYLIESDIFGRSVACRIPAVGVMCLVHSHGWALHDENSFHDGLMSFWLSEFGKNQSQKLIRPSWKLFSSRRARYILMVEPSVMRTVFTTVLWASGFDSYQTHLTLTGHGYLIESDIFGRSVACRIPVVVVVCLVRYILMVEPSVMRTVFTTVLWASGFDSYQTQLTLTDHGYVIESDIFGRSVACLIPVVGVMCLVHSHGWALRDENSFHDGLMSFWLWFLPNSAHSDGPWLPDWKRYIWEECSLSNTSCGCYVSRTFVMVEPSMMRTVFTTVLWASGFDSYQTQLTLTGHGYLIESDTFGRGVACRIPVVGVLCLVHSHGWALRDENSFHDGLMSFLALILTKLSSLWTGKWFFCACQRDSLESHGLRLHTFECNTLWPFAPILHPESPWGVYCGLLVLGDCKYSCQLRFVTMLFSQHVALCQCWLVSQHGTGIWNCFARKVATYQLMLADSCLILVMERYRNLNQAYLKWWEQFSRRSYELLALILTKLSSLWRASGFLCMPLIRRNTWTETAHFWMQYTLTFCTHLAPRVTVGCVLWPPGARGLQIFMSASVVTMLFSQHVALCQCWLVSQHGTGIWNCFARKVATYQWMLADSCFM